MTDDIVVVFCQRCCWARDKPPFGAITADKRTEAGHAMRAKRFAIYVTCMSEKPHYAGLRPVAQMLLVLCDLARVNFKFVRERLALEEKEMKAYMRLKHIRFTEENSRVEALLAAFVAVYLWGKYYYVASQRSETSQMRTSYEIRGFLDNLDEHGCKKRSFDALNGEGKLLSSHSTCGVGEQRTDTEWHRNGAAPRETYYADQCVVVEQRLGKQIKRLEEPTRWRPCLACDELLASEEQYYRHLATAFNRAADKLYKAGDPMRTWSALRVEKIRMSSNVCLQEENSRRMTNESSTTDPTNTGLP